MLSTTVVAAFLMAFLELFVINVDIADFLLLNGIVLQRFFV